MLFLRTEPITLARYQINDPLMMENSDQLSAVYSNGLEEVNYLGDMGQLLRSSVMN